MATFLPPNALRDLCPTCSLGAQQSVAGKQETTICPSCGGWNGNKSFKEKRRIDWISLTFKLVILVPLCLFMLIFAPHFVALFVFLTVIGVTLGNLFGADWNKM